MNNEILWFGTACLVMSVLFGANSNIAFSQLPPPQDQLQPLSCPYGYHLAQNHLCYPIQSQSTNGTQSPAENQLRTLSCPYGYYLATNYLCYLLQSQHANRVQLPPLFNQTSNGTQVTEIINEVRPGLPRLPLTISDDNHALVIFFINSTDGHYHLKGVKRNVLPEMTTIPPVTVGFYDQTSGRTIAIALENFSIVDVAPGGLQHFDIDTKYNVTRAAKEFKYMYGHILGP